MANGRPGRRCVDRGVKSDGEPYVTTPRFREWQEKYRKENPDKCSQSQRNWRLNLTEEQKAARRLAAKLYMRKWTREKRKKEILAEMEQRRKKTGG